MPGKKPLRLLIGVRLRDPAAEAAAAEAVLREAEARPGGPEEPPRLPLAWNLPLHPLEQGLAALASRIKARVKAGTDTLLLMGYGGAPNPLLRAEELEKELAWCRRNPWGPASRGLLGQEPRHLLPAAADLLRERLEGTYSRQGVLSVGLALPAQQALRRFSRKGSYRFLAGTPEGTADSAVDAGAAAARTTERRPNRTPARTVFYHAVLLPPAPQPVRPVNLVEALTPGQEPLFLLLDLGASAARLGPVLDALAARYELELLTLEQALPLGTAPAPEVSWPAPDPLELTGPRALEASARAESSRARGRRRTEADIRAALTAWGPQPPSRPVMRAGRRAAAGETDIASLVASMSGLVTLDGPGFAVSFADGRFAGLLRQGRQLLAGQPAESYLVVGGRRVPLWTESAFSFERDDSSGLRSVLKGSLPSGEAELVTQAFFPAREKHLQLDCVLRLPDLPPGLELQAVEPLELPLFRFARGDYVEVAVELSERVTHSLAFPAQEDETLLCGTRFRLARDPGAPRLTLAPGPPAASGLLALPVRVVRVRREFLFLASPFGSCASVSAAAWSGKTLRFSLLIGLEGQLPAVDRPG